MKSGKHFIWALISINIHHGFLTELVDPGSDNFKGNKTRSRLVESSFLRAGGERLRVDTSISISPFSGKNLLCIYIRRVFPHERSAIQIVRRECNIDLSKISVYSSNSIIETWNFIITNRSLQASVWRQIERLSKDCECTAL